MQTRPFLVPIFALPLLGACTGVVKNTDDEPPDDSGSPAACTPVEVEPGPKDTGDGPRAARTLAGTITWQVDFDADAEALGYSDCSYTRDYNDFVERTDLGWLCPTCTLLTEGTAVMVSGHDDCYAQIDDHDAERVEQLGLAESGDTVGFWRTGTQNVRLSQQGDLVEGAVAFGDSAVLDSGGGYTLSASGTIVAGEADTATVDDPSGARTEPYSCGWPLFSPGGTTPGYTLATGATFPNARLGDTCHEGVDLWDFRGRYVVVDASAPDCGPCQEMAKRADAFKAAMADQCIDVEMITLLDAGLSQVNLPADWVTLENWRTRFGLASPVLADEGFGYAVLAPALNPDGGMGLPSWALLDPDGRMILLGSGFGETSGYFDPIQAAILADSAER